MNTRGRLILTRDRRDDVRDRCKKALEIAGIDTFRNRHSTVRWDRRSHWVATTEMWGRRRGVFRERATDIIIYLLELPAENVYWNCHIYRFGLLEQRFRGR